jgi:hypothetical protein
MAHHTQDDKVEITIRFRNYVENIFGQVEYLAKYKENVFVTPYSLVTLNYQICNSYYYMNYIPESHTHVYTISPWR